ncbi:MAG TPA: DUF2339 domain-containing protein, partial [Chthoniobacterales bacterium]|nr:DUF2339 domain-containing protein [Chthoniobacterales bacterium]
MSDKDFFGCVAAALFFLAPLILLIIALVQLRKLKTAVRNLVQRVTQLEARGGAEVSAPPATEAKKAEPVIAPAVPLVRPIAPPVESTPPPAPPPIPRPSARPLDVPPPPPMPPSPPAKPFDWEAFFGVKLFAWIGGFVLFLGIVFLVKYSFENNLITPAMRVVIGTVIGIGLIATGWFTAWRNYRVSGQSLCATGVLVLYGNIFAAHVFYHLIALGPAFASMAVVTAAAFFLAVRMNA